MSLDFHIATSKEAAKKSQPDFSVEEDDHAALFANTPLPEDALLLKFSDYTSDTRYSHQELPALHAELAELLTSFRQQKIFRIMYTLATLAEKAIEQKADIYVFAD